MFKKKKKSNNQTVNNPQVVNETGSANSGKQAKSGSFGRLMHNILDGTILTRESFVKSLPFTFYLVLLIIIYISINFKTENKLIEINKINKELKELRFEHISTRAKLMQMKHSSYVAKRLYEIGIKIPVEQPAKITIKNNRTKNTNKQ